MMDKNLLMDAKMLEECWMTCLGKQCGRDWFRSWCCIMRVWCLLASTKCIPSSSLVLAHVLFAFSYALKCSMIFITLIRVVIGLCFVNQCISCCSWVRISFVCVCCVLWIYDIALRLNCIAMNYWLYLLTWFLTWSKVWALVGQPTRIGHVWRIIRHSTLPTNHLVIYNKHMVHEIN